MGLARHPGSTDFLFRPEAAEASFREVEAWEPRESSCFFPQSFLRGLGETAGMLGKVLSFPLHEGRKLDSGMNRRL